MSELNPQYVESMPSDFERFVGGFFPHRGWRAEVKYDHREGRLFLEIRLDDLKLSSDDRFLSLVAFYARSQRLFLRRNGGEIDLQCRLLSNEGADLTSRLHGAETSLDDTDRAGALGRQLAWLSFRRRLLRVFVPKTLMWAAIIAALMIALGFSLSLAVLLCLIAALTQSVLAGFVNR